MNSDSPSSKEVEKCPVCGEEYNHWINNGYRNTWPLIAKVAVCTPTDSDEMYVHVVKVVR